MNPAIAATDDEYLKFLGLEQHPFPVAPDDEHFFMSEPIERIIAEIVHGVMARKGFLVLTGDVGLGKTTVSRRIIALLEKEGVETALLFHTFLQDIELLREINRDFGIKAKDTESQPDNLSHQMNLLNDHLLECNRNQRNCAIIIDDAQNLNPRSLELVRMISNLEAGRKKLVQILLIGQPELLDRLDSHDLRQLKSRLIIKAEARPLSAEELKNYLLFKLAMAGNHGQISLHPKTCRMIFRLTAGNFRQVNNLMDRCLYVMYLKDTREISPKVAAAAHADLSGQPARVKKRPLDLAAAILLAAGLSAGGWLIYGQSGFGPNSAKALPPAVGALPAGGLSAKDRPAAATKADDELMQVTFETPLSRSLSKMPADIAVPEALDSFLAAYGLSVYGQAFAGALKRHAIDDVSKTVARQTGYRLIRLTAVSEKVRQQYGLLCLPDERSGRNQYYLFWKPMVRLDQFYYAYRGQEILWLQEILASLHLYEGQLDSIVGKKLMQAIIRFQEQSDLPVTGYPDDATLFLLSHVNKENLGNG
jgi:general secretion pathway protein A